MGDKVGENPTALRAAVFLLSAKKPQGGGVFKHPPPAGRRLKQDLVIERGVDITLDIHDRYFICYLSVTFFYKFSPNLLNGLICEDRTLAKQSLLRRS